MKVKRTLTLLLFLLGMVACGDFTDPLSSDPHDIAVSGSNENNSGSNENNSGSNENN